MADTANPTTPGIHNHLGGSAAPRGSENRRRDIDQVFGLDAPIIEGLPIEIGHGCKSIEWQLAEHVKRIAADNRDAAKELMQKLLAAGSIDRQKLTNELIERNLLSWKTAADKRVLDEFLPAGSPN